MKILDISEHRTRTKSYWFAILGVAVAVSSMAIFAATRFPFSKIAVLLSAIFISALMSQYELRLPKTQIEISVGTVIAIWGVFWLGVSGGILLGAAASLARLTRERKQTAHGLFSAASSILAIAIAASIFGALYDFNADADIKWTGLDNSQLIITGVLVMTAVNFVVYTSLDFAYRMSEGSHKQRYGRRLLLRLLGTVPVIASATVLCVLFAYFGIAFGLVVVPIAVFAILAYRVHLNRLQQKTSEILEASRVHLATVEALATAIDARDQVGAGHVRRTQIYAVGLGEAMGLTDEEIAALRTGALLHDIGKLAVPDHILSKPGTLSPAELEKTKIHPEVGASILEKVGFSYPVIPTVKFHHECWDGTGYPKGLAGDKIPLTARVLAVADAYDTLRNPRPYRPAITKARAREILIGRSGTQFDPSVINVFLKKLASFEADVTAAGLGYESDRVEGQHETEDTSQSYVEQIKLANKEVYTLYELAREFGSSENLAEMLALFAQKINELVPFDTCAVYLLDSTKRFADAAHVEGQNDELLRSRRLKVGEGATGFVLKEQKAIKNVNPDLDFSLSNLELIQQYSTMASLPLFAESGLIGAVSIYSIDLESYGEENLRVLETISRIAADAISKSQQHAENKAHALTDPMTGLPNARSLKMQFDKEVGRATRAGNGFQVLVLDLDGFKAVNDTFGHKVGDEMLRQVGRVISEQLRDYDFLSRYGGDEFVALVPDASFQDVADLCTRIERAVADYKLPVSEGVFASVGVSLGAAGYPDGGESFDQMIVAADKQMYSKKSRRKAAAAKQLVVKSDIRREILDAEEILDSEYVGGMISNEGFIVELDESAVVASAAIN